MENFLSSLEEAVIKDGFEVTKEDALTLYSYPDFENLCKSADRIRRHFCSNKSSVCSIVNAKRGGCREDCAYCAQSARHKTSCLKTDFIKSEKAVELVQRALKGKVCRVSLVSAGRSLEEPDFKSALAAVKQIKSRFGDQVALCASFGILPQEKLFALKEAGVERYHHNLESGRAYFDKLCTTHSYEERVQTVLNAKKCSLEVCSGGIIGAGEQREDRIDMALDLRRLQVQSVPVNILTPIPGTPLENALPITKEEILRTIAVFRFIMPSQTIRLAAGRKSIGDNGKDSFTSGANALISGDFLTTPGSSNEEDLAMLKTLGYTIQTHPHPSAG